MFNFRTGIDLKILDDFNRNGLEILIRYSDIPEYLTLESTAYNTINRVKNL